MITITEEITINADYQKVWGFLSDFEISLNVNSFHKKIIIPDKFSLTGNNPKFNIIHNFGLGNIDMIVEIVNYSPLKTIELFKKNNNKSYTSFEHSSKYELIKNEHSTLLKYFRLFKQNNLASSFSSIFCSGSPSSSYSKTKYKSGYFFAVLLSHPVGGHQAVSNEYSISPFVL